MAEIAPDADLLEDLTPEQRQELERRRHLRVGRDLVWIELDGRVRRQRFDSVYYFQTERGVFRVSRLDGEVVEV
jgi:hypothetical protein